MDTKLEQLKTLSMELLEKYEDAQYLSVRTQSFNVYDSSHNLEDEVDNYKMRIQRLCADFSDMKGRKEF